jgi:AbrB family looped-hinge helix DNA binding protein
MSGNQNPYDPTKMFQEWIQKSGKAQAEFIRNFGAMMGNQQSQTFDPLSTLKEIGDNMSNAQASFMNNLSSLQSQGIEKMLSLQQMIPNFMSWGAYKTTVGSNGRISIPEAERNALGLEEGSLVQVVILPINKKSKKEEVK